ncbi:MAG: SDR family oxidoreductase [Bacteroidales bacterium]|nr:SDR family oxidoreductase [Bacteroidales bacterium]
MGKVIIITGASSGFGKSAAELLSHRGHTVYGISRREIEITGVNSLALDVRDKEAIQQNLKAIAEKEGRVDVLINNAGMGIGGALELASTEEIDVQMGTNFMGCVNMCQAVLPYMRQQGCGRIINVSSIGGVMGLPYQGFYSASKFAIEGFSEALSAEVKRFGIQVCLVEPGDFATGFTASRRNSEVTLKDPDYGPVFRHSLHLIEKEENGGLKPEKMAQRLAKIAECHNPKMRYVVANLEQWASVVLKRFIPGNWFVNILRGYYKS